MKKYTLEITETLKKQITILAQSKEDAIQLIKQQYDNEEIILDHNDHKQISIKVVTKNHETAHESLKKGYKKGTRIRCLYMNDPYQPVPEGMTGTITAIDDAGTIHVHWDNGSSLGVIPGIDLFEKIE